MAEIVSLSRVQHYKAERVKLMDRIWDIAIKEKEVPAWWGPWFKQPTIDLIMNR